MCKKLKRRKKKAPYKILKFNIDREENFRKILILKNILFVKKIIDIDKIKMKTKIMTLINKSENLLKVTKSFMKFDFNFLTDICESIQRTNKYEIINRLKLLLNYFNINDLTFMNVEIRKISEINNMNFNDLFIYYTDVFDSIENSLNLIIELCNYHNSIESKYVKYCHILNKN